MEGIVNSMTEIKICGITREEEISWLNEAGVSYAGFVFYEKSKRYISVEKAKQISEKLNPDIRKVAVTVSPDQTLVRQIAQAGFDILQIHGAFGPEITADASSVLWQAVNLSGMEELRRWRISQEESVRGILFDAGEFGSGKTFGWDAGEKEAWEQEFSRFRSGLKEQGKQFILAGGLHPENVAEGIALFAPDVVDVSSGVEETGDGKRGKSREKIKRFVQAVRSASCSA